MDIRAVAGRNVALRIRRGLKHMTEAPRIGIIDRLVLGSLAESVSRNVGLDCRDIAQKYVGKSVDLGPILCAAGNDDRCAVPNEQSS